MKRKLAVVLALAAIASVVVFLIPATAPQPPSPPRSAAGVDAVLVSYFDTLPDQHGTPMWVTAAFVVNAFFAASHPSHRFVYYYAKDEEVPPMESGLPEDCDGGNRTKQQLCIGPRGCRLHPDWCKVKAVIAASTQDFPTAKYFVWLDGDAVIRNRGISVPSWFQTLEQRHNVNLHNTPFITSREGSGYWCEQVVKRKAPFTHCVNGGVFAFVNTDKAQDVLQRWWASALDPYDMKHNPMAFNFRMYWPWEQDRLNVLASTDPSIAVLPVMTKGDAPRALPADPADHVRSGQPCLGYLPGYECYVDHWMKDRMMKLTLALRARNDALSEVLRCWRPGAKCYPNSAVPMPESLSLPELSHAFLQIIVNETLQRPGWNWLLLQSIAAVLVPTHTRSLS